MADNVIVLNDENFKEEVIASELPCMVDFWAEWCGPCKMIAPAIEELAGMFEGKIKVCKMNVEQSQRTTSQYRIMNIPTLLLFKSGELVDTITGVLPKDSIEKRMEALL